MKYQKHSLEPKESLMEDTVQDTESQSSTPEVLMLVWPGLRVLMQVLSTSSSERREIITAHHAHSPTLDIQLKELDNKIH